MNTLYVAGDCWLSADEAYDIRGEGSRLEIPLLSVYTEESAFTSCFCLCVCSLLFSVFAFSFSGSHFELL